MRKPTRMVYLFMKVYPAFGDWQKNDIRDVSIISSTYPKKFGNYIQSYSITFVNKRKIILSYVSEI